LSEVLQRRSNVEELQNLQLEILGMAEGGTVDLLLYRLIALDIQNKPSDDGDGMTTSSTRLMRSCYTC